jgi:hypothetical protein
MHRLFDTTETDELVQHVAAWKRGDEFRAPCRQADNFLII